MPSFGFIPHTVSEEKIFKHFYENQPFLPPRQPIKFTDLDKSHMKRRRLLNKISVKKIQNIPNETEKIVNFLFSHYKSMGTISCHSNQSSYLNGTKKQLFVPPTYRCYIWNMRRIGPAASEKKSFENVDDGWRTDDRYLYILKAHPWAFGSGELIII